MRELKAGDLIVQWNDWYRCAIVQKIEGQKLSLFLIANPRDKCLTVQTGATVDYFLSGFERYYYFDTTINAYRNRNEV